MAASSATQQEETSQGLYCHHHAQKARQVAPAGADRHWDFKYLHSYTPPFRQAVLEAYHSYTGIIPDPSASPSIMPSPPLHTSRGV